MEYTVNLENALFSLAQNDEDIDSKKVIEFLNSSEGFRSFGEGLKSIITQKHGEIDCIHYILNKGKEMEIEFNRNTVKNWFAGKRPKKGEQSRKHMFLIAFALQLTIEETKNLFKKVYLDRPFNLRDPKEIIYYFCINNGHTYKDAKRLMNELRFEEFSEEVIVATQHLENDIKLLCNEEDLLFYIKTHAHNFQISKVSAKDTLRILIKKIKGSEEDKEKLKNKKVDDTCGYITRECYIYKDLLDTGKDLSSISTMLAVIEGGDLVNMRKENIAIFKNANFPQEIISRFPTKHTFTNDEPTFEELRKMIILLYSYELWFKKQYENKELDFDDYIYKLNELLDYSNLQLLYYGNPYDWLFLYCTLADRPLDVFRELLADALWNQ